MGGPRRCGRTGALLGGPGGGSGRTAALRPDGGAVAHTGDVGQGGAMFGHAQVNHVVAVLQRRHRVLVHHVLQAHVVHLRGHRSDPK